MCLSKVEVERALVEAEQESEVAALQQEKDALEALHNKMADLETKSQQEKEKVFNKLRFMPTDTLDQKALIHRLRYLMMDLQIVCLFVLGGWGVFVLLLFFLKWTHNGEKHVLEPFSYHIIFCTPNMGFDQEYAFPFPRCMCSSETVVHIGGHVTNW